MFYFLRGQVKFTIASKFLQYYTGLLNNMANDYTLQFAWITDGPERDAMISRNLTGL